MASALCLLSPCALTAGYAEPILLRTAKPGRGHLICLLHWPYHSEASTRALATLIDTAGDGKKRGKQQAACELWRSFPRAFSQARSWVTHVALQDSCLWGPEQTLVPFVFPASREELEDDCREESAGDFRALGLDSVGISAQLLKDGKHLCSK